MVNAAGASGRSASSSPPASSNLLWLLHAPAAVGIARRRVRAELAEHGLAGPALDDVAVVVSELLGNAVRHARPITGGALLVAWELDGQIVTVKVTDGGSAQRVQPCLTGVMAETGRGLRIVEGLSRDWGVVEHVGGLRTVWAALPVRSNVSSLRLIR